MKATINGIEVEGTPEEIHTLMEMQKQHPLVTEWLDTPIRKRCMNNVCYCDGSCLKEEATTLF